MSWVRNWTAASISAFIFALYLLVEGKTWAALIANYFFNVITIQKSITQMQCIKHFVKGTNKLSRYSWNLNNEEKK